MTVLLISFLIGSIFIVVGIRFNSNNKHLQKNGVKTEGRVRGYKKSNTTPGSPIYYPIVSYYDQEKNIYEEELSIGFSYQPWDIGDTFEVIYDPEEPSNVVQAKQSIFSLGPMLFTIIGVGILILGLLSYLEVI